MRLWVRMKEDAPPKNPAAWLFRVVRNLAADGARRHRRERSAAERLAVERSAWFEPPPETSDSAEPLTAALEQLAPELREVVVAKIWGELTFDEIAEITGTPKSSVFDRYRKALETLRTAVYRSHLSFTVDPAKNTPDHEVVRGGSGKES